MNKTLLFIAFSLHSITHLLGADIAILNANVYTVDRNKPHAEAVAISKNRILAVGTNAEIKKLVTPSTTVVNANGKLVLPVLTTHICTVLVADYHCSNLTWRVVRQLK